MKKLEEFLFLLFASNEKYFFRGHGNAEWKIESSYFRHGNSADRGNAVHIFQERIEYIKKRGVKKNYLDLLAEMQHHGLKTLLIDFTSDILHALWFAFSDDIASDNNTKVGIESNNNIEYRSLYILEQNKTNKFTIDDLSEGGEVYDCPMGISRGLSQKSYFVLDNIDWNNNEKIFKVEISNKLQNDILKFLNTKSITASKIYPDLKGLMFEYETVSSAFWLDKGFTFYHLDKYNKAIECCDKVIELEPDNWKAYNNKGLSLSNLGRHNEAIEYYDKGIELDPNNWQAYYNKGVSLSDLGMHNEAIECDDKVIEIDPNNWQAYYNKGLSLSHLGKHDEAIECYDKAIELNPNNCKAYTNKGRSLSNLGRYDEAKECYDKAKECNDKSD